MTTEHFDPRIARYVLRVNEEGEPVVDVSAMADEIDRLNDRFSMLSDEDGVRDTLVRVCSTIGITDPAVLLLESREGETYADVLIRLLSNRIYVSTTESMRNRNLMDPRYV